MIAALSLDDQKLKLPGVPEVKAAPDTADAAKTSSDVGSAGIAAAGNLLGGLLANQAAQQTQMRMLQGEAAKMTEEERAKALAASQKGQQDALAKLMGSFKSALA